MNVRQSKLSVSLQSVGAIITYLTASAVCVMYHWVVTLNLEKS